MRGEFWLARRSVGSWSPLCARRSTASKPIAVDLREQIPDILRRRAKVVPVKPEVPILPVDDPLLPRLRVEEFERELGGTAPTTGEEDKNELEGDVAAHEADELF